MPLWLQAVGVVVVAIVLLTPLIGWADNRHRAHAQSRYESWPCPQCGEPFGRQDQPRGWMIRRDPFIPGAPVDGPILRCSRCAADFAFDSEGRQVDDHKEYVNRTA